MFQKVVCFHCVPMQQSCVHRVFRFKTLYCTCSSCVPMQWRRLKVCSRSGSQGTRCSSWNLCRHHVHHHHHPYHKTPGALRAQRANTGKTLPPPHSSPSSPKSSSPSPSPSLSPCLAYKVPKPQPTPPRNTLRSFFRHIYFLDGRILHIIIIRIWIYI